MSPLTNFEKGEGIGVTRISIIINNAIKADARAASLDRARNASRGNKTSGAGKVVVREPVGQGGAADKAGNRAEAAADNGGVKRASAPRPTDCHLSAIGFAAERARPNKRSYALVILKRDFVLAAPTG